MAIDSVIDNDEFPQFSLRKFAFIPIKGQALEPEYDVSFELPRPVLCHKFSKVDIKRRTDLP